VRATTQRKIDALQERMPLKPLQDVVASAQLARERIQIAELYLAEGELSQAAEWFRKAARFCRDSGAPLPAIAIVKRALRSSPEDADSLALYAELWRMCGLGESPEPVG